MGRGVSSGGGQSSLGYLFGSGESPKQATPGPQLSPSEGQSANNGATPKSVTSQSPLVDIAKQIPAGIHSTSTNNYSRADGQNTGNFITDRPSTRFTQPQVEDLHLVTCSAMVLEDLKNDMFHGYHVPLKLFLSLYKTYIPMRSSKLLCESLGLSIMIQSDCFWFIPTTAFRLHVSFETLLFVSLFMAVFGLFLAPGGLAWALSKSATMAAIRGPSGFPLAGLLTLLSGSNPHRALAKLSMRFNSMPLMAFSVGFTRFIISSRPETAREILHSSAFADRPLKESAYELLFHRAMGFAPYGEYWRNLRRISATHLFSPKRIAGFEGLRRDIGLKMAEDIGSSMAENGEVEIKKTIHFGSLNNVMMTVFGRRYDFSEAGDGFALEALVTEGYELLGIFNWSDHFPLLGLLDLQGVRKRSRKLVSEVNLFVGKIIEEHRNKRADGVEDSVKDFVDVLLDLEEEKLSDSDMIAVLWEMIFRGTDTVAILLEWIMARMVLHPEIQLKAQAEIDRVIGFSEPITDSHVQNLSYLQCIVKECLRMHPPGPLLSWARLAVHDVHIAGAFTVPAGTTAMVNMWAITHDPTVWPEPDKFHPERFLDQSVSLLGSDLALAPFGAGRRVCPGKTMALASVHLWLAHLLRTFTWVRSNEKGVDLTEVLKLSLEMKTPLICKAIPRPSF